MGLIKIFFFGDSICFGQGISLHKGWVPRISAGLEKFAQDQNIDILAVNSAVNGRITRQALEQMPYEVQSHTPDLLVIQFGLNDCNYWLSDHGLPRVSPMAFEANLEEIISRALKSGIQKILLNTNHPTGHDQDIIPHTNTTYEKSNSQYNKIIRKVAKQADGPVVLNDIEKVFLEYTGGSRKRLLELLLPKPDLLHLGEKGHLLYYNVLFPVIKDNILELIVEQP